MAALVSLIPLVPVRDVPSVPAVTVRPVLHLAWRRPAAAPHPLASWHRAPDGRLVCAWQLAAGQTTRS
jgi:hypothetical protein